MSAILKSDALERVARFISVKHDIVVRRFQSGDEGRWDAFVESCPEATFFHRSAWKDVIERAFGHTTWFLYAESDTGIEAILPLAEIKSSLFGHALISLPFCVYGGIAAKSNEARKALHWEAQQLAARLKVGYLEYRNLKPMESTWIMHDLYYTFRKDISANEHENFFAIPHKRRANIRKGILDGLTSQTDGDVDNFYRAFSASAHRVGTPVFSKRYFQILKETFGADCEVLTVTKQNKMVSSVLSFYFRDEVLPHYGGGIVGALEGGANDFMYWEVMRRAADRGCRTYDFGRSKANTVSFSFKRNWGFQPQPLPYAYQLHGAKGLPENNAVILEHRLLTKVWQLIPQPMTNLIGPHIVKRLG